MPIIVNMFMYFRNGNIRILGWVYRGNGNAVSHESSHNTIIAHFFFSKNLLFLQEQKIGSAEELRERATAATERYHAMGDSIKAAEARLTEIAVLKTHIINYAKTRDVYAAYRKAGYSKTFLEAHREEITLHKAAKAAFDEAEMQKLPKVKELDAEFAELLTKKKAAYPDYRKARNEMQGLVRAQKNVERFFAEEKPAQENEQAR